MGFITNTGKSGKGSDKSVTTVNGKVGDVVLTAQDIQAVSNILGSCGGIQVGSLTDMPPTSENNSLYVAIDRKPNEFYRFDSIQSDWIKIGENLMVTNEF